MPEAHGPKHLVSYFVRQFLYFVMRDRYYKQNRTQFKTCCCEYAFISSFKQKEINPKGHSACHCVKATFQCLIIRELQVSAAVSTLVILFCHNWSELLGKNICGQPPHLYWEFVPGLFQNLSPSMSGREQHIRKQTFNNIYFMFWLC